MLRSQSDESDKSHIGGDGTLNLEARSDKCKNEDVMAECVATHFTGRQVGWMDVGWKSSIRGHCVVLLL